MADRNVRVTLTADVDEYEAAMARATEAARELKDALAAIGDAPINVRVERKYCVVPSDDAQFVRSGEPHCEPDAEATVDQWEVDELPVIDFASKALREAQDRYRRTYGDRAEMSDFLWVLRRKRHD